MRCISGKFLAVTIAIAILPISTFVINDFSPAFAFFPNIPMRQTLTYESEPMIDANSTDVTNLIDVTNPIADKFTTPTNKPPTPKPTSLPTYNNGNPTSTSYSTSTIITYPTPTIESTPIPSPPPPPYSRNESFLLAAIKSMPSGGKIILEENLGIIGQDVTIQSNITLTAINPQITIYLEGKRLVVAQNSTNVIIKDLTIDASAVTDRPLTIGLGATKIKIENVVFKNYGGAATCLLNNGNQVELNNLSFINVLNAYPIKIQGSNVSLKNSYSNDNSKYGLVYVGGGISNVSIIGNTASNRPLLAANYGPTSTNILIENNTNYFPNGTYGLLILGGTDGVQMPHENVTVKGNFFSAAEGAWNAISIYGVTRNSLVICNTVDMSLSGHNGIAISSGINVTVVGNTVYGANEAFEGGIEVESNPVHNRGAGFSENITVSGNTIHNSTWGIYVRVMAPEHPNWNGTILISRNIVIENNTVFACKVGVNLLQGENLTVRNNDITSNMTPFAVDAAKVSNYTVTGNLGYP